MYVGVGWGGVGVGGGGGGAPPAYAEWGLWRRLAVQQLVQACARLVPAAPHRTPTAWPSPAADDITIRNESSQTIKVMER